MRKGTKGRVLAGTALAGMVLAGCYSPNVKVAADEMGEVDRATYLILTDQLQRVRNVLQRDAKVCVGLLPEGHSGGLALVPDDVVARLKSEQEALQPRLELLSGVRCLAYYVQEKAGITPESSDILAYAGAPGYAHKCGHWMGGLYNQGSINRNAIYDVEVKNGVAELTGGEDCRGITWYRS